MGDGDDAEEHDGDEDTQTWGDSGDGGGGAEDASDEGDDGDGGAFEGLDHHITGFAGDVEGHRDDQGKECGEHHGEAPPLDAGVAGTLGGVGEGFAAEHLRDLPEAESLGVGLVAVHAEFVWIEGGFDSGEGCWGLDDLFASDLNETFDEVPAAVVEGCGLSGDRS